MNRDHANNIVVGDCLDVMKSMKAETIDLIYIDPPFNTEKSHKLKNKDSTKEYSFDDLWGSDNNYTKFLYDRILLMHSLLKNDGSIFVHCDKSAEHIVRAILDQIFGSKNFQSEIIWNYKRWSNSRKGLLPNHQNIYFYSKSSSYKFNMMYKPYSETTNIDQILQRRTRDVNNKTVYDVDSLGEFKLGDKKIGVPLSDVWDIPYLNPKAKERVGYPTQKPILLLERIINLSTNEGDLVMDPFCGSGTTCVAAKLLKRRFIGIDISSEAVDLSQSRIDRPIKTDSKLLRAGRNSYLNADKNALMLLSGIPFNPVQRNKSIDAILVEHYQGSPVLIRVQKENETLSEAATLLLKAMRTKKSKKSILIRTNHHSLFEECINNDSIILIDSPAIQIGDALNIS